MTEDPTSVLTASPQITELVHTFNSQMQLYLPIAVILSLVITLLLVINIVQKLRVNAAILRMDKNIKKLVDDQRLSGTRTHSSPAAKEPVHTSDVFEQRSSYQNK